MIGHNSRGEIRNGPMAGRAVSVQWDPTGSGIHLSVMGDSPGDGFDIWCDTWADAEDWFLEWDVDWQTGL
jgi:hypothetical protein